MQQYTYSLQSQYIKW